VGFRFRRRDKDERRMGVKEKDAAAVEQVLDEAKALFNGGPDIDLRRPLLQLFQRCPTPDLRELRASGTSGESFYREEIKPNWDGLDRGERAAKIEAFARFANVIARSRDDGDTAGLGPVVRTKVVVLAWAFDSLYRDDYLERIVARPEAFGELEATPAA
jgi:hypothetical protein